MSLEDAINTVNIIYPHIENNTNNISIIKKIITDKIYSYTKDIDLSNFFDDDDVIIAIDNNSDSEDGLSYLCDEISAATQTVKFSQPRASLKVSHITLA
ncbi:hypothetical protein [Pectinatus frisingensis]|uniref:hypothetical protein n=1 Tax=Pectinatus frisingensis TaxID=865 RepID=UPI0018C6E451|nr:hypothetical protein [Pectinatus frisingensis]